MDMGPWVLLAHQVLGARARLCRFLHTHRHTLFHSHNPTHTHLHTITHTLHTLTYLHTLTHIHSHTLISPIHSLTPTHTLTHTYTLSLTHSHHVGVITDSEDRLNNPGRWSLGRGSKCISTLALWLGSRASLSCPRIPANLLTVL